MWRALTFEYLFVPLLYYHPHTILLNSISTFIFHNLHAFPFKKNLNAKQKGTKCFAVIKIKNCHEFYLENRDHFIFHPTLFIRR